MGAMTAAGTLSRAQRSWCFGPWGEDVGTSILALSTQSMGVGVLVPPVLSAACAFAGLRTSPPEEVPQAEWLLPPTLWVHSPPSGFRHEAGRQCTAR